MKSQRFVKLGSAGLLALILCAGCVQLPTEKQEISDLRPQISFRLDSEEFAGAQIYVDGQYSGSAGDFVAGRAALRLLPGTHVVEARLGNRLLLSDRVYVGDGVSKTFILK